MNRLLAAARPPAAFGLDRHGPAVATTCPTRSIDALLGLPDAAHGGITVDSSSHLAGALDPAGLGRPRRRPDDVLERRRSQAPTGQWLQVDLGPRRSPSTTSTCSSWPTAATRCRPRSPSTPDGDPAGRSTVPLPGRRRRQPGANATVSVPVDFPPVTGQVAARRRHRRRASSTSEDWYSDAPGARRRWPSPSWASPACRCPAPAATFDSGCRADLLTVDDTPVPVRVTGSTADAIDRKALAVAACGADPTVDHRRRRARAAHRRRPRARHRHRPAGAGVGPGRRGHGRRRAGRRAGRPRARPITVTHRGPGQLRRHASTHADRAVLAGRRPVVERRLDGHRQRQDPARRPR